MGVADGDSASPEPGEQAVIRAAASAIATIFMEPPYLDGSAGSTCEATLAQVPSLVEMGRNLRDIPPVANQC